MKHRDNWHKLTEREQLEYERISRKLETERDIVGLTPEQRERYDAARRGPVRLASPFEGLSL